MYKFKTFTSMRVKDVDVDKKINMWIEQHPRAVIMTVKYSCTDDYQSILIMFSEPDYEDED